MLKYVCQQKQYQPWVSVILIKCIKTYYNFGLRLFGKTLLIIENWQEIQNLWQNFTTQLKCIVYNEQGHQGQISAV